jgi:hypothetical protein
MHGKTTLKIASFILKERRNVVIEVNENSREDAYEYD